MSTLSSRSALLSSPSSSKTRITVVYRGREEVISWYESVAPSDIERLMRQIFDIPSTFNLLLRDLDGDACVISPRLPSQRYYLFGLSSDRSPYSSSSAPISSLSSSSVGHSSPVGLASSFAGASSSSSSSASPLGASKLNSSSLSASGLGASPLRSPARSALSFSSLDIGGSESLSASKSPASRSRVDSTSAIKEVLRQVDNLRQFERKVRELRNEKLDDFFVLDDTGRFIFKRFVSHSEFMSAISSDLYYNAGASGILASKRRNDVEKILNAALSSYMDAIRSMGLDILASSDAGFARQALYNAYESVLSAVQELIREKLTDSDSL